MIMHRALHLEMTKIDYMYQEKKEEEDSPALKIVSTDHWKNTRIMLKRAKKDSIPNSQ